ncbi:MAG: biotin--[acetyl-CoA-carboxylase] ligase [Microbacteriaceae bacterium]|nr:biotin--[acetyl-CoA-carboxylase] ligase [Microbacteriaceae bacterium]
MLLPRTAAISQLTLLDKTESTNTVLVAQSATAAEFATVITLDQTAGKGRLGRVWETLPGRGAAISVLLRPRLSTGGPLELAAWGWLPLMAGLAMTRAITEVLITEVVISEELPDRGNAPTAAVPTVSVKWPNDVLVDGRKVSGILAELLPGGDGLVLGAGVNLFHTPEELPTPISTSLATAGATLRGSALVDAICSAYLSELRSLYADFLTADGDAQSSGLRAAVIARCSTLGQLVRVHLPDGQLKTGEAIDLDSGGRLLFRAGTTVTAVAAGDVEHLRYE